MTTSNIRVGQSLRLTVRFADFDYSAGTDELLDPNNVSLALFQYQATNATPAWEFITDLNPILHSGVGIYYHDWITPSDGKFKLVFTGITPGATPSTMTDTRIFYVGNSVPTVILNTPIEFTFLAELSPLYLDPEEFSVLLPEISIIDITESIYKASLQLEKWFGANLIITDEMGDYIFASVLCDLSKSYLLEDGLGGMGTSDEFTLGDLTVKHAKVGANRFNGIYHGNVSSWCDLAWVLRNRLLSSQITYKAIVKGSNFINPIPPRQLRRFD